MRNLGLRGKLTASLMLITYMLLVFVTFLYDQTTRMNLVDAANQSLHTAALQVSERVDNYIRARVDELRVAGELPIFRPFLALPPDQRANSPQEDQIISTLTVLVGRDGMPFASSAALLDSQGRNIADVVYANIGTDESQRVYFQQAKQTRTPYISAIQFPTSAGTPDFYISHPIVDESTGEVLGVLRLSSSAGIFQHLLRNSRGLAGDESHAILLDENGLRIAHDTRPDLQFRTVFPLSPTEIADLYAVQRLPNLPPDALTTHLPAFRQGLHQQDTTPFFVSPTSDNSDQVFSVALSPLETQPWVVAFVQPRDVFLAPVQAQTRRALLVALGLALVVGLAVVLVARWLTEPVLQLTQTARQVAAGDLTIQATVASRDEIGTLADVFNTMITRLRHTLHTLELRVDDLARSNATLEDRSQELQTALGRVEALMTARADAVRSAVHDLRHSSQSIQAALDIWAMRLRDTGLAPDLLDEGYQQVLLAVHQQNELLSDMRDAALLETGNLVLKPQATNLVALVETVAEQLRPHFLLATCELAVHVPTPVPDAWCDPQRLRRVLYNILENAYRYTTTVREDGLVQVWITADETALVCQVHDNGRGIAAADLARLGQKFTRLNAGEHDPEGMGLGLNFCIGILRLSNGSLELTSPGVGQGATATIRLPLAPAQSSLPTRC